MQACVENSSDPLALLGASERLVRREVQEVKDSEGAGLLVGSLPGVEAAHLAMLVRRGVTTIGTLRGIPKPVLVSVFGKDVGEEIWMRARGREKRKTSVWGALIPFFGR